MTLPNSARDVIEVRVDLYPYDPSVVGVVAKHVSTHDFSGVGLAGGAAVFYDGVIDESFTFSNDLFQAGQIAGHSDAGRGVLILANPADQGDLSGRYDTWRRLRWRGRRIVVAYGKQGDPSANYTILLDGLVASIAFPADQVQLSIASNLDRLNKPVSVQYAGTGGLEGDVNAKGKFKPVGVGQNREVAAVLIDPTNGIWQFHNGKAHALQRVCAQGLDVPSGGADVVDYATLVGTGVAAGTYRSSLASSLIKTATDITPKAPLTCDFQGDDDAGFGGYVSKSADLAARIMGKYYGLVSGTGPGTYGAASVTALNALQAGVAGYWAGAGENGLDILDRLLGGAGAGYTDDALTGTIIFGRLDLPTISGPSDPNCKFVITDSDVPDTADAFSELAQADPILSASVGYKRFYTTQTSGVAATLTAARIAELAEDYRLATAAGVGTVPTEFPGAIPLVVESQLDDVADAGPEATRLVTVFGVPTAIFRIVTFTDPFSIPLLSQGWVSSARHDLAAGMPAVLIGKSLDLLSNQVAMTVWGQRP